MDRGVSRKVRSDKKVDVKPTLNIELKDAVYRLSYVARQPVKNVGEELCIIAFHSNEIIIQLAPYFQRNIKIGKTLYIGRADNKQMAKRLPGHNEKITIRFKQQDFNCIYDLAYAVSVTPSRVVAVLIEFAMSSEVIVSDYVNKYVEGRMTDGQLREFEEIKKQLR